MDGRLVDVLDGMGWYWRVNDGRRNVQHGKVFGVVISSKRISKSTRNGRL